MCCCCVDDRCVEARSFEFCRNCIYLSSGWSTRQVPATVRKPFQLTAEPIIYLLHLFHYRLRPTAVRKNRYVILPADFDEAWKVSPCFMIQLRRWALACSRFCAGAKADASSALQTFIKDVRLTRLCFPTSCPRTASRQERRRHS